MTPQLPTPRPGAGAASAAIAVAVRLSLMARRLPIAAVPLYRAVLPGHRLRRHHAGGQPAPGHQGARTLTVRFDANVGAGPALDLRARDAADHAADRHDRHRLLQGARTCRTEPIGATPPTTSRPTSAGGYFDKIACFCFTEQTLGAGRDGRMPVVFFLDPALETGRDHERASTPSRCPTRSSPPRPQPAVAAGRQQPKAPRRRSSEPDRGSRRRLTGRGERGKSPERLLDDQSERGTRHGRRPRQAEPRLPPRRSEPVAAGRLDQRLRHGGRRASCG